jgi:membrane-bound lytic murein transglycosylase D
MAFKVRNTLMTVFQRYKRYMYALGTLITLSLLVHLFSFSTREGVSDAEYKEYFNSNYRVFGLNIPKDLSFAGEKPPLHDFSVREGMDRELMINTYWQSQTLLLIKRANRWFPLIEETLKQHGIPEDFKYIALIESQLTNAVSPAGACGYWQLLESTGKVYNLEVSSEVDERYHVAKSTEAACKYFKEAYNKFKNWTLVAASYNLGMAGVERQLSKQQVNNYYDLLLNEETARYIYRILAIKDIITRPKAYGFLLRKKDLYPPISTTKIAIDSSITDLADFALKQGYNYKILKLFNPWLRKNALTNREKKKYFIEFPKKGWNIYADDYFDLNPGYDADTVRYVTHQDFKSDSNLQQIIHVVKEHESISSIATQYELQEEKIKMWNLLPDQDSLRPNQEIILYIKKK